MRLSQWCLMQASSLAMKPSSLTPLQSRQQRSSFLSLPKSPSHAVLPGLGSLADMLLASSAPRGSTPARPTCSGHLCPNEAQLRCILPPLGDGCLEARAGEPCRGVPSWRPCGGLPEL